MYIDGAIEFSIEEKRRLRNLAKIVGGIAKDERQEVKRRKWYALNSLQSEEPVVLASPENGWHEIITDEMLECTSHLAREWEFHLMQEIYWDQKINDDKVIEPFFDIPYVYSDTGWGLELKKVGGENGGAYHIEPPIKNYEEDFSKLQFPELVIDYVATEKMMEIAQDVFGDLLEVRLHNQWWWSLGMTWDFINLRGLDHFMMDLILAPEWVHRLMNFLTEGYEKRIDFLINKGLLHANNTTDYIGSGGYGYSKELKEASDVILESMWGFCESQETVGISPSMFNEFILPYHKRLLKRFKLSCYGCCEPIDTRWDYVKTIPNLRRVSASAWVDMERMCRQIGSDYILSAKPSPTPLASSTMNEDLVRKTLKHIVETSQGMNVEIIMKDNHTLGNVPMNIVNWVRIAREEINKVYAKASS